MIAFLPDLDYSSWIRSISLPAAIFTAIPIVSAGIVMVMYLSEHRKWRQNVLFLVDFLSLFTNQEMQEGCMKELGRSGEIKCRIVGEDNEIKDEEKLREMVCDAYAVYKKVSAEEAKSFVDLHYKAALKEYRRRFVTQGWLVCLILELESIKKARKVPRERFSKAPLPNLFRTSEARRW